MWFELHLNRIYKAYKGPKNAEGYQRLEELVSKTESKDDSKISYEQLKLMKNFFDSYTGNKKDTPYLLNGGTLNLPTHGAGASVGITAGNYAPGLFPQKEAA